MVERMELFYNETGGLSVVEIRRPVCFAKARSGFSGRQARDRHLVDIGLVQPNPEWVRWVTSGDSDDVIEKNNPHMQKKSTSYLHSRL